MSFADDTCDFCGSYIDPIGGDTAIEFNDGKYWSGQCYGGADYLYGSEDTQTLIAELENMEGIIKENPPWPHVKDPSRTPDSLQNHLAKLRILTYISAIRKVLKQRGEL